MDSEPDSDDARIDVELDWGDYVSLVLAMAQTVLLPFIVVVLLLVLLLVFVLLYV